tara:strand:- start:6582 stop:6764 length:183 start_codon:yes stop_codon:yes gene_type:complete
MRLADFWAECHYCGEFIEYDQDRSSPLEPECPTCEGPGSYSVVGKDGKPEPMEDACSTAT